MTMAPPTLAAHHTMSMVQQNPMGNSPMAYTSTKGLLNEPGQNNCFLNSAVQVLWHLDIFRRSFRDLSGHACMAESCIFCALKELFSQLQYSTETALPPDALRRALAESFFDQQRFQLGFMDDAAECFENMLLRIHMHIANGEAEDMCNARHCIPHQKFAMTLVEQSVCKSCGATSEPLSYTQMVHYVSTSTLVYQVRTKPQGGDPFGVLLRKAGNMGDVRVCPSMCGAVIQINRTLMNHPEIVSVGLVWNSERPTLEHIMEVFSSIGTTLRLGDIFTVVDQRWAENSVHDLVGVVTYYGKHYSTFFFHTKLRVWIYFDDATVREIGPKWEQVVEKCRKGRYQPLLLLYALPDGTPVNTENAPKQITPFYNTGNTKLPLRRSVTPSPEKPIIGNTRRAITPNPDCKQTINKQNDYQNLSVIQNNIYSRGVDVVDGDPSRKNIHRTLSNGSSSGTEVYFKDYPNIPRTRDSGNWSSDRNSASSSSSTTMENPYLYLPGKPPSGGSNSSAGYDIGYDSHSLSSNDSSTVTTVQHMMKMGHLAKIPEDYSSQSHQISQSCDVLCDEADELLVKSRQLEDDHDLVLALALCNAAATKARAAMDAPYNNPQTLTLARMKHNTCIMRARSLHRRMTQTPPNNNVFPEIRHTREGSSGSGRHSRQNSRDKSSHSRQNSKELVEKITPKNIEIYATLPKKKDGKNKSPPVDRDEEYILYDKPARESRSIFSRNKNKTEKRSRSEDRNKIAREEEISQQKEEKPKEKTKKQHKIRRKLMGGLMRRKNRSMPDLTEAAVDTAPKTMDDSKIGLKQTPPTTMCGYLSEGHLDFSNPNLERSKLMRKSFHGSAGKILTAAKVPPPPPLRTTSQLSKNNDNRPVKSSENLPPYSQIIRADVHKEQDQGPGVDEVDCLPHPQILDLPPYPSPMGSVIHSRQASEEFPPPPPPIDLSALDEHLPQTSGSPGSLLAMVQNKRLQIMSNDDARFNPEPPKIGGDNWLKELQAKQAALKMKKESEGVDVVRQHYTPAELEMKKKGVKELTSKFETVQIVEDLKKEIDEQKSKPRLAKKKSVSFCDQVILVATAEDDQDDSYIPNPILERVLRSAMNKPEAASIRKEVAMKQAEQEKLENEIYVSRDLQNAERQLYGTNAHRPSPYQRIPQNSPVHIQNATNLLQNGPSQWQNNSIQLQNNSSYLQGPPIHPQVAPNHIQSSPNQLQNTPSPYNQMQNAPVHLQNPQNHLQNLPNHLKATPNDYQNNSLYNQVQKYKQLPNGYQGQDPSRQDPNLFRQQPDSQFRQSPYPTPNPHPVYQHPPSPSPSTNYNQQYARQVPISDYYPSNNNHEDHVTYSPYQQLPNCCLEAVIQQQQQEIYQRVPPPHMEQNKYNPYQQVPPPKPYVKKTVSFEAGTKGGIEPSKAVVTPIIVNNANNSVPTGKTKCNLCRKKAVVSSNLYCVDCEFYMSRFKPKR